MRTRREMDAAIPATTSKCYFDHIKKPSPLTLSHIPGKTELDRSVKS